MGVTVQQGYTASSSSGGMTLLGTLTTTSGTTQSLTSIAAGYRQLYCEIQGVSLAAINQILTVALSSTNGAAYGTAVNISTILGNTGATFDGWLVIGNISATQANGKIMQPFVRESNGPALFTTIAAVATNTADVVDAIRFGVTGSSFDAGTIRVYGVK